MLKNKSYALLPILVTVFASILVSLTSCRSGKEYPVTSFGTISVNRTVPLTDSKGFPKCNFIFSFRYAAGQNKQINETINNTLIRELLDEGKSSPAVAVDSFIARYSLLYKTQTASLYKNDIKNAQTAGWYSFYYTLKTYTEDGADSVICYKSDFERFEGGPQAYHVKRWLNFHKETGKRIVLSDIFRPGYENALSQLLLKALMEKFNFKNEQAMHNAGFLNNAEMYPSDNYLIKPDALVFLYNTSEIAPRTAGDIELTIPGDELEDLLRTYN